MTIVVEQSWTGTATAGTSVVVTVSGITAGNVLVAYVASDHSDVMSSSDSFTQVFQGNHTLLSHCLWFKVALSGDASATDYTWTGNDEARAIIMYELSGVNTASVIDDSGAALSNAYAYTATPTATTITTVTDGCLIISGFSTERGDTAHSLDTGEAPTLVSVLNAAVGTSTGIEASIGAGILTVADATVPYAHTDDGGTIEHGFFQVAISPSTTSVTAAILISGAASATEASIVAGTESITVSLTNDTFVATLGADNAITTAFIAGIDGDVSGGTGWDVKIKGILTYTDITRTSSTVVTINLPAAATYDITTAETITITVPATSLTAASAILATPTLTINVGQITSITDPLADASTGNALVVTGFAGNITTVTVEDIISANQISLTSSLSGSGDSYTVSMPDVAAYSSDTLGTAFGTEYWTHIVTASDGTDTDTITAVISPKSGWDVVDVNAAVTTEGSVFFGWTGTPQAYDQVYYPTASNTAVSPTGILTTDVEAGAIDMVYFDQTDSKWKPFDVITVQAVPTGTVTASVDESDIVTGGKTIVLTLTDDTFIAAGTGPVGSTANTQALIDGIDGDVAGGTGWDAVVKAGLVPADDVVRTSDTVCTITLPAFASYSISATETISVVIPSVVLTGSSAITASPMFTVADTATTTVTAVAGLITSSSTELDIRDGDKTIVITLTDDTWVISGTPFNAVRQAIINGMTSAQTETLGWNNVVRDAITVSTVVRTSNDTVTITLPALSTYDITAQETITITVPASALVTSADAIVAGNTFTVGTYVAATAVRDTLGATRTTATTRSSATRTTATSRDTIR